MLTLLPPANEVWGMVIFLHLFVILFTGGGACVVAQAGACVVAPGGCAWLLWGACVVARGRAWLLQGACMVARGGGHAWDTMRYGDTVNQRAVCILLECILVLHIYLFGKERIVARLLCWVHRNVICSVHSLIQQGWIQDFP